MKHFNTLQEKLYNQEFLLYLLPLLFIVPNVALCFTEPMSTIAKITNVLLPLACYSYLLSLSPKIGRSILLFFPVMFFDAFQIVLLYLYGQSIIAVDMLLNVVTTNPGEVFELLGNLVAAILTVVILYVPVLVYAVIIIRKKKRLCSPIVPKYRKCTLAAIIAGCISLSCCYIFDKNYSVTEELFPVNVCDNVVRAVKRTVKTNNYEKTSAEFTYDATSSRPATREEIYVMVIGETGRAANWQMFGYNRPTNPNLNGKEGVVGFGRVLTESNTTHKSVPMLMSPVSAENFDSIYYRKGIITAFKEAGFHTSFYSNQRRNRSFIDYFGSEADTVDYISDNSDINLDEELAELLEKELSVGNYDKRFIILHAYGSHFNYKERYPDNMAVFRPDNVVDASASYRNELINAYDNTIIYTDRLLSDIIDSLQKHTDADIAMMYVSDHGEDIFDDSRNRFLHASPIPTYYQLHVPMIIWMSKSYRDLHTDIWANIHDNKSKNVSSSASVFHTMLQIAGINTGYRNDRLSLADSSYTEPERLYLSDRNEALPMSESGMNYRDFDILKNKRLFAE